MKVTQSDLLDALWEALAKPADGEGESVHDLVLKTGMTQSTVRSRLQELGRQGRLIVGRRRTRTAIDGRMSVTPVYRVKPK